MVRIIGWQTPRSRRIDLSNAKEREIYLMVCCYIQSCNYEQHPNSAGVVSGLPLKESTNVTSTRALGLAQRRLCLKPSKKAKSIYKPLPQVTKTSLYDEHWAAKQERGK